MVFNFYELINEKEMKQTYTIVFLADLHTLYDDRIYWKQAISLVKNGYNVHYITIGDVNGIIEKTVATVPCGSLITVKNPI